jgi:hypothetical protein
MNIERASLCPEHRSSDVSGGSVTCSVVGWSFRFVTAANRVLPLLSGVGSATEFSVFFSVAPARFGFSDFCADELVLVMRDPCDGSIDHE